MTTQTEAERLADALDCHEHIGMSKAAAELRRLEAVNKELTAKLAEQPAQQEPVAWWDAKLGVFNEKHFDQLQPLYTSPPAQRKPLTDEQIRDIHWSKPMDEYAFARAIEAAHGIKENT